VVYNYVTNSLLVRKTQLL